MESVSSPASPEPTGHEPTGHEPTGHEPTGHEPTGHNRTGRKRPGREPAGHEPAHVQAAHRRAARRAAMAPISFPAELPVTQRRDEIARAIQDNQVVIIAGETGSGKTTQIPKICLEIGRGINGQIGHTQPRRLAARTVAERIAEELHSPLGEAVGYKVRFTDKSADDTLIKLMTDGILLTELARDRRLRRYDTLIIDEAHERSLNIDFILGCLRQLLPTRPELKVIITSATIDPQRFADAFGGAPVIEVSGRTYPVEVRYRPVAQDTDQAQAIVDAVGELSREVPGDVLVFLSGEREIRDTAEALNGAGQDRLEVLPLYSRLSAAEQHKVFSRVASSFTRRVVLATNVAETSLTVPGIRYVIDPGTARISRYSRGTKVQRLPIEPISQASANQRKGRCGRLSDGICIRLYSEADFESRPEFTDPEILRTNLASVILQMAAIGLGDVPAFPFIDPPEARNIADGTALLTELNAFSNGHITRLGRQLARLPVDPRIGRMILAADRNGCVLEVLIIAAALSIQDPRERPTDAQEAADAAHRRFADPDSDFVAYLNLWEYLRERQSELSSSAFRRMCRGEYLNYLRVREWQDLHGQLQRLAADIGVTVSSNSHISERNVVHQSLLTGLLSQIGMKVDVTAASSARSSAGRPAGRRARTEYLGARSARFAIFPGSGLARKPPDWIVAAELVETSRLFARIAARIEPEWVEPLAQHLIRRSYSEPHWEKKRGSAVALEKVTLYGIPLVADRKVSYGRIDPVSSRELFIRHALVEGDWDTTHRFFHENRRLLAEAAELEHRVRRRGLVVGEEELYALYDARVPPEVVSAQHFDTWWKQARRADPELLTFKVSDLVAEDAAGLEAGSYPDAWTSQSPGLSGAGLPLSYEFAPGTEGDGVTVDIPLSRLNQMDADEFSWQVPGLRAELVTELIRSLPKALRRDLVPAPDVAREVLARLGPPAGDIRDAVAGELRSLRGVDVPRDAWDLSKLPPHLRLTFRVVDDDRGEQVLGSGDDLGELQRQLRPRLRARLEAAAGDLIRTGLTSWNFGRLPEVFRSGDVVAYPAFADAGSAVDVRLYETERAARTAMWAGTRRLILLGVPSPVKSIADGLPTAAKLALSNNPHGGVAAMFADCVNCAADYLMAQAGGPVRERDAFDKLRDAVRASLHEVTAEVVRQVESALRLSRAVEVRLDDNRADAVRLAVDDMRAQLTGLIYPGFVTATGYRRLPSLARYLRGMERRLDRLPENPGRDAVNMAVVQRVQQAFRQAAADPRGGAAAEIRWLIEELRVSLFAQTLGTPVPVSENRIMVAISRLSDR